MYFTILYAFFISNSQISECQSMTKKKKNVFFYHTLQDKLKADIIWMSHSPLELHFWILYIMMWFQILLCFFWKGQKRSFVSSLSSKLQQLWFQSSKKFYNCTFIMLMWSSRPAAMGHWTQIKVWPITLSLQSLYFISVQHGVNLNIQYFWSICRGVV